ncbi:MAG: amidohydrolase family protein [Pseudomonadota bacterium]
MNWRFGLLLVPAFAWSQTPPAVSMPYVDTHVHPLAGSMDEPRAIMQQSGIRAMVLMPPPQVSGMRRISDYESFVTAAREQPGQFAFLGGGGSLNPMIHDTAAERVDAALRDRFVARARKILADGAAGFGEMSPHHLAARPGHPYESVPADHPLFLLLADIAAEHGAVIDTHFDLVAREMTLPAVFSTALNPAVLRANLEGFERLLAHNRGARIVWAHAGADPLGHWTPQLSRELLARHLNLYMSVRMGGGQARMQNLMLHSGGGLDPQWRAVLEEFADRFVLGGDQFFAAGLPGSGPGIEFSRFAPIQRQQQAIFLSLLPPEAARKIGYENALRLYKLKD